MSKLKIAGWVLSVLISLFFIVGSASGKFLNFEGKEEMFAKLGWGIELMYAIGVVEVAVAILFLIPRAAFIGAILLSAYLGGAVSTHVRVGDPFWFPIAMGVLAWIALGLRDQRVFSLAFQSPAHSTISKTGKDAA